ncbi:PREDICTED: outer dense fiber protein 2-like isoform X1 [Gekko japonicus]|uniref:Outer dense fiber protein 2-like isoform X1 n=1 Tax=Gekko japonicus TaxID=146911 RepID=A0ABM1KES8_GEKJA|nr:PREDICTED: outer dense fiber protein 2-like isoform X1 [Gekko japonicus]
MHKSVTADQHRKYLSCPNEDVDSSDNHLSECIVKEPLKENWSSYNRLVNQHRAKIKELLPCLKRKSQDNTLEESMNETETKWLQEGAINENVTFRKKLQEAELAIGSAEMFLPSFKETLDRITKACYVSASDMVKISMQADLLVKELEALKNMKGWLQQLLRASKEKEITSKRLRELTQTLTESESEALDLKNEVLQKERIILEHSAQLQQERADVRKASHQVELVQVVQNHLQCQIEKKEAENNQLRTKIQAIEKNITEWKLQIGEQKQQILAEKERRRERKAALKKAASVQKHRAEHLEASVENLISKIKEKEIQLTEALTASNVWKSHHQTVVDEKTRLEVQVITLKKQVEDHLLELQRLLDDGRKSKGEILGKLKSVLSEKENVSLENAKLKASSAALEAGIKSAEAELLDLHEEAKQQENLVNQYKTEVQKLEMEAKELKARYEKVVQERGKLMEAKDLEMHKVDNSDDFLKHHSLEDENYTIQMKYEEVQRKLGEMELQNKGLENQLANQEENLQKTELQFKQKLASYSALTRQLEAALEDGRKRLAEEVEKISSKEQVLQLKILDLENELRQKKEEHKQLARKLNNSEKHREVCLKELEHSLQKSENQNQSLQNYVQFLKTTYVTIFG